MNNIQQATKLVCLGAKNPETIRIIKANQAFNKNFSFIGFIDNDKTKWGSSFFGYKILGGIQEVDKLSKQGVSFCNIITGSTISRYETSRDIVKYGGKLVNLMHPNVDLDMVKIGTGNYIQNDAIVQAGVSIGNNNSIHIGSLVSHQSIIGNSVFISFGCNIAGEVNIEDGVFVGAGATILPRLKIGKWSIIGAGAVIIKDVPEYSVIVGNPGRIIRQTEHLYEDGNIY